jgi:uncharacterized protein YjlB
MDVGMIGKDINVQPELIAHLIKEKDPFPNNAQLPLLVYTGAFSFQEKLDPAAIEKVFLQNSWLGSWRNGLYPFHHYHSTAHEVLGVYSGSVRVQFGGEDGLLIVAGPGDVLVLPAGLAHKNIWSSHDFRVVGAYPKGTSWDMNYGKEGERPGADKNIAAVPLPEKDPVYGAEGKLFRHWNS